MIYPQTFFIIAAFIVYSLAQLGLQCSENNICEYFLSESVCLNGTCRCISEDAVISSDGAKCLSAAAGYGSSCTDNVQCAASLGSGGTCGEGGVCQCTAAYHYLKGKCWKSIPLDGQCFMDEQCYAAFDFSGLECKDSKCGCRPEYYRRAGACRRRSKPGESCIFDGDCTCDNGVGKCDSRSCHCPGKGVLEDLNTLTDSFHMDLKATSACETGFYEINAVCVPEIGSRCSSNDPPCNAGATGAICIDNRACGCDPLRIRASNNRACSKLTVSFNTSCMSNEACISFGVNSVCAETAGKNTCTCQGNSHFDNIKNYCVLNRLIGEKCDDNADCYTTSGQFVACVDGKCGCVNGTHATDDARDCRPDALRVGDACLFDADCGFPHSKCNTTLQQCVCLSNYFPSEGGECLLGVGGNCADCMECHNLLNTECSTAGPCQCLCKEGHVSSSDFSECLPFRNYGENCQQDEQCMGDLRECKDGFCMCQEGAQFLFSRCYEIKRLGEKCKARAECISPGDEGASDNYICQNGKCACQYGSTANGERCV